MSLNLVDGIMGAGKTYTCVNFFMLDELRNGDRHIYTNLPIKPDVIAGDLARGRPTKRREALDRLHMLENKQSPVFDSDGNRTTRLARECGWRHLRDVTGASLEAWRDRAQPRLAAKTVKEYQGLAFAFFGWLVRAGRIHENPLRLVSPVRTAGRERRQRRALSADELSQLRASLKARGLRGLYREAFYVWSYFSGARRNESKQLMIVDLTLTADAPFAKLRASTTKNGEEAVQPLPLDAAALLSEHLSRIRATRGKVFPYGVPTAKTFREDLVAAGIQPFDELGRQVDIHALRTSYATHLLMNDVPVRTVQELMRHSDIRLTTKVYTDAKALPLFEAVKAIKVPAPSVSHLVSLPAGKTGAKVANRGQEKVSDAAGKNIPAQRENAAETAVKLAERVGFEPTLGY